MAIATAQLPNLYQAPHVDARRTAQNTNDLRGKINRIKVNADGSYSIPAGNMFPVGTPKTRPEIYAMGFRNPYRIQVDSNNVAYITDYSPDSNVPENFRGPAGTGRVEIVTKPSNYGWPLCYAPDLPYYRWNFNTSRPLDATPTAYECGNPTRGPQNTSRWVRDGGPAVEPGLEYAPPIVQPDIWYSYRDNTPGSLLGTPCLAYYNGSGATTCPRLFPELFTGGVAPHGAAKYEFNAANPNKKKFPPYYDNSMFLGEFGAGHAARGQARLAGQDPQDQPAAQLRRGAVQPHAAVRVRQPERHAVRSRRRLLPADVRRRLLRRQPGRRHVQVGVRQGPARAERRAQRRQDGRPGPADGELHLDGHGRRRSG